MIFCFDCCQNLIFSHCLSVAEFGELKSVFLISAHAQVNKACVPSEEVELNGGRKLFDGTARVYDERS